MARTLPNINAPEALEVRKDQEYITLVREYKLITPLFGGGVEPGEADPVTVVRATEIRGHLRFWWRATRGGQFNGCLEKMKAAEDVLWGAASTKELNGQALVQVTIESLSKPESFKPIDRGGQPAPHIGHPKSRHSYAAFPLNEKKGQVQTNISFRLTLRYPKQGSVAEDVQAALWAWETFGGIGGRTRRGFGALARRNESELPSMAEVQRTLLEQITDIVATGTWHPEVSHLSADPLSLVFVVSAKDRQWATRLAHHNNDKPLAMWDLLIQRLRDFRQDRPLVGIGSPPGRTRWPEADALREYTGMAAHYTDVDGRLHDHRLPSVTLSGAPIKVFPRAAFGLPLIFQFKDNLGAINKDARAYADRGNPLSGPRDPDPNPITIEGKNFRRWASPLILRPLQCCDGVLGIALVLAQPDMTKATLQLVGATHTSPRTTLTTPEALAIPMLRGGTDVIRSFLEYVKGY